MPPPFLEFSIDSFFDWLRFDEMHGIGKMTHKDGRVCKGIWENGKIVYEGELNENGKPHGRGKWTYSDSVNGREERSVVSLKTFILSPCHQHPQQRTAGGFG